LIHNVGGEFGRRCFERNFHRLDDLPYGLGQRFGDLAFGDGDFLRHAVQKIAALDLQRLARTHVRRAGGADILLDAFGAGFADQQVKVTTDIGDDRFVHLVAADAYRTRIDDAAEREHSHFGRAAADVDDHRASWFGNGKTRTNRGS